MPDLIIPLRAATERNLVGGKAIALGDLLRQEFLVPEGFVVTTQATRAWNKELEDKIVASFDQLNTGYVAVRSSATNEDSDQASWAGQLETYLNVTREDILKHVKRCQESPTSLRVKAYANQQGLAVGQIAVIVQKMVQSEQSGVGFSVHPVTHNADQIVLEAAYGLGEAVVSGEITPDTYIVNKNTGEILEKHVAAQPKKLVLNTQGLNEWQRLEKIDSLQKIPDALIQRLATLVSELENYYEYPVDVEWGFADGKLYVLQCRPITTLAY